MRALVTGASQGIGLGIATRLAPGSRIAICGSSASARLDRAAAEVRAAGGEPVVLTGDLGDAEVPALLVERAVEALGGLDCLIANAAERAPNRLLETSFEAWQRSFDVNVRATWRLAVTAHGALRESRGSVVAIGSVSGAIPHAGFGPYSGSKAALEMLVRQLAVEWASDGIRVNMVRPGFTITPKTESALGDEDLRQARLKMVPLGRFGRPDDVAAAVAFFAGPDAGYCTGQCLNVDGGLLDSLFAQDPGLPPVQAQSSRSRA